MKSLTESLFDDKLIEKDILDNPGFKKWINRPDTLWYIFYYWETGEDQWLNDFKKQEWQIYKPFVDEVIDIINDSMKKVIGKGYSWYMINFDAFVMTIG